MRSFFTAPLLLCLLAAFTGCQMLESVVPKPDGEEAADSTGLGWCIVYSVESVDTIRKGSYLGFTIGQKASSSYVVLQNLALQKKAYPAIPITMELSDHAQLEKLLPLYSMLILRPVDTPGPEVFVFLEEGKVQTIREYTLDSTLTLTQWPAAEPASAAVRAGETAATAAKKLLSLKDKQPYAGSFESVFISQKDFTQGYDPAMGSMPEWSFRMKTGKNKEDEIYLQFRQGTLSAIINRHLTFR